MTRTLRAAIAARSCQDLQQLADEVAFRPGRDVDHPGVLAAIRLAVIDAEPGHSPDSRLIAAIAGARWTAAQVTQACAQLSELGANSPHAPFWNALAHEVALAGVVAIPLSWPRR